MQIQPTNPINDSQVEATPSDGAAPTIVSTATETATLLGKVMSLVGIAISVLAFGTWVGREITPGAALTFSLVGFGMLLAQSFGGQRFRVGRFATAWLMGIALLVGLGLGPVLAYYASADPTAITQAAGVTALVVAIAAVYGFYVGKDLVGWLRPLTFVIFGLVVVSIILLLFSDGGNPLLSLAIAAVSTVLIVVDFNYLRRHGTEDDAVSLATGIFVSIVNIFLAMLNIFGRD